VGGLAAVAQGAPLATIDVEVVHRREPANVDRLLSFLARSALRSGARIDAVPRDQPAKRGSRRSGSLIGSPRSWATSRYPFARASSRAENAPSPCQIPPALLSMGQKARQAGGAQPSEENDMTTQTFAKPPQNRIAPALQVATVVAALLLGAAFVTSMFSDTAEEQLRAALGPASAQHVRS